MFTVMFIWFAIAICLDLFAPNRDKKSKHHWYDLQRNCRGKRRF